MHEKDKLAKELDKQKGFKPANKKSLTEKQGIVKSRASKTADWIIALFFVILIFICLVPLLNIVARSLSSSNAIAARKVGIFPVELTFESYSLVLNDRSYTWSLQFTAILTLICTLWSLFMTIMCAFPFVYEKLRGRRIFNTIILITMYFGAGAIPTYLLMQSLHLLDNPLVLIVPNCLSVFNVIILKSFFYSISESLRESAEIEGANPLQVLIHIYLPLSTSVLATLALFYAVGRWNGFGDALMFITNPDLEPIQLKLYKLIQSLGSIDTAGLDSGSSRTGLSQSLKAATVVFATVPILLVYPWLQKYFVEGVSIGAIKE